MFVNGEEIKQSEIEQEMERLRPQYNQHVRQATGTTGDDELRQWCTENLVERTLMRQQAQKEDEPVPAEEIEAFLKKNSAQFQGMEEAEAETQARSHLQLGRLIQKVAEGAEAVTDDEAKAFYKENQGDFLAPEQVHVRHIVKHVRTEAEQNPAYVHMLNVKEQLKKGASFEELAAANSDCPDNAGDLGYFGRGQMVQQFEDVVFGMQKDEVSDVFLTEFGYHIAKVLDRQPGGPVPFEQVGDTIKNRLTGERRSKAVEAYIDSLKETAEIQR